MYVGGNFVFVRCLFNQCGATLHRNVVSVESVVTYPSSLQMELRLSL